MKLKFIKDKDVFADLEECFGDFAVSCLRLTELSQEIVSLLKQLGVAIKPARARLLKRKLRIKLQLLAWNSDGKSCETYEREIQTLRSLVADAIGSKSVR